jgi:transglutaminase-like putative cysteine protease
MRSYIDLFGNRVTRVEVPAGLVTFSNRFVIHDSGEPDETLPDVRTTPVADLPNDVLLFLVSSRYCDSDKLADFAWSQFGTLPGGAGCVQAICDFVHAKIRFSYPDASPTRCASDSMHEGVGVCRDFAHLAIALCRCMNIPAATAPAISATSAFRSTSIRWISAPGSRSFSMGVGTRWTRVTIIPASAALLWDADVTPRTSRCRPPLASPNSCASRW